MFPHRLTYFPMSTLLMLLPQKLFLPGFNNLIGSDTKLRKISLNPDGVRKDDIKYSAGGLLKTLVIQGLIDYQ